MTLNFCAHSYKKMHISNPFRGVTSALLLGGQSSFPSLVTGLAGLLFLCSGLVTLM